MGSSQTFPISAESVHTTSAPSFTKPPNSHWLKEFILKGFVEYDMSKVILLNRFVEVFCQWQNMRWEVGWREGALMEQIQTSESNITILA